MKEPTKKQWREIEKMANIVKAAELLADSAHEDNIPFDDLLPMLRAQFERKMQNL